MLTDIRIKIRNFIKKHKWKVILLIVGWSVLVAISLVLSNWENDTPQTTYTPYEPIIENGQTTPKKWQDEIEETIQTYIGYCNQKEYQKAYDMINENCRKKVYPELKYFKAYVDYVFAQPKVYAIQNYSNRDKVYIYRIRLFDDILATGMTYDETFKYFEEKLVFTEDNGKLLLAVKSYIGDETLDAMYEDQYMKITVTNKSITYDEETYTVKIQNKTENTIVLADEITEGEINIQTENGNKAMIIEENWKPIYIEPRSSHTYTLAFSQFYDEGIATTGIQFNRVRILRSYSGQEELKEKELEEAVSLYSFVLPLK